MSRNSAKRNQTRYSGDILIKHSHGAVSFFVCLSLKLGDFQTNNNIE